PRTLRSELAHRDRLRPVEAAGLTLRLARALGHLHLHGLVHRDIKPSNVIFVAGQPKLADIGLVTDVGSSHSFVGTEGFIPPEGPGSPQADLYGLGKLLYELATGRDRLDFPQLPPRLRQHAEGEALLELNEVITRACAPEVQQRYATAPELQADLNLFLAGRSLRRARNFERHLMRLKKFAAAACAVLVVLSLALWFSKREERHAREMARSATERAQAEAESRAKETTLRLRAEAAEHETEQQLYTALLEQARATVRSGELGQRLRALDAVRRAAAISNRVELRREAMAALALPDLRFEREVPLESDFTMTWLDPALARVALCRGRGPVEIRAVSDNRLLATLPASTNLMAYAARWSNDGRFLAVKRDYFGGGARADLEVWEVNDRRRVLLLKDVRFNARSFHPHKPQLLVAGADGLIMLWDLEQQKELARRTFDATPENLAHSPDGTLVAASYRTKDGWGVSTHEAADGARVASQVFANFPSSLEWQPDGNRIAVTDYGGLVQLMDARTGKLHALGRHKAEAATSVFSPSGDYLLTGGWERELICWDVRTMQRAFTVGLDSYIAQFRADGRSVALLKKTGILLHTFESPSAHRELAPEMGPRLWHAAFSPEGRWLAASADQRAGVWDLTRNAPGAFATEGFETQLFWAPNGRELFGSSRSGDCFHWRIQSGTNPAAPPVLERLELPRPPGFASLSLASNLMVWTSPKGSLVTSLENASSDGERWTETASGISRISPNGRWLAIYRPFGTVLHVYRLPRLEPVARLTNRASIAGFSFSPVQDEVAVASRGQVEFWSTTSWERTRAITDFIGIPHVGMLFGPDGRSLWLVKDYRSAGLYQSQTLEPLLFLPSGMLPLALDADGRYLAASVDAQRVQVWDLMALRRQLRALGLDWQDPDG
ncbi:MAG: hypothetical protein L0Z50_00405, partial [Verrucomicrobiales bacterium]|nr:hypothetical protein [Verrucomicrobiales bacterium]